MNLILLTTDYLVDWNDISDGYTINIEKSEISSSHKQSFYNRVNVIEEQLVADILGGEVSALKIVFLESKSSPDMSSAMVSDPTTMFASWVTPPFEIQISSTSTNDNENIFKRLWHRFQDKVRIFLSLSSISGFENRLVFASNEGMKIDQKNYTCTDTCRVLGCESKDFKRWRRTSQLLRILAWIPDSLVCPNAYLRLESELPRNNHKKILEEALFSDITVVARNGAEIPCHKSFLAVSSLVLKSMFGSGMIESQTGRLDMSDMSEQGVWAFLRYLYYGDLEGPTKDIELAYEVLYAGHKYNIPMLEAEMVKCLTEMKDEDIPVEVAFAIYLFVKDIIIAFTLKMKTVRILKSKREELETLPPYQEFLQNSPDDVQELNRLLDFVLSETPCDRACFHMN